MAMAVPRYLFRVFSPGSAGSNSPNSFESQGYVVGDHRATKLSDLNHYVARDMLANHIIWSRQGSSNNDILISFTPSLLYALQHAIRKTAKCRGTNPENCMIMILDTTRHPPGTFHWTPDLLRHYHLDENFDYRLQHSWNAAEYLAEYALFDLAETSRCVSLQELELDGFIFHIVPELADPWYREKLWIRVQELKQIYYGQEPQPITEQDMSLAHVFAKFFGGQWYIPMFVWALAFKTRSSQDAMLINDLRDGKFGDVASPFVSIINIKLPEDVLQWSELMTAAKNAQAELVRARTNVHRTGIEYALDKPAVFIKKPEEVEDLFDMSFIRLALSEM